MRNSITAKISTGIGTAALLVYFAAAPGYAAPPNRAGPHPAAAPRSAAAVPHFAAPSVSRFTAGNARPLFDRYTGHVGRPHVGRPHVAHSRVSHFAAPVGHFHPRVTPSVRTNATANIGNGRPNAVGNVAALRRRISGTTDPRNFASHRHFAADPAFRPFLGARWRFNHHYGWIGPWFWPYAYGDLFYDALWPYEYAYYDPFWYYGYDDIYEGIFSPYDYSDYVQGPGAPERMSALTQTVAQSCADEAAEVAGWPIDQIQSALSPNQQQTALLDDLGNAVVKASDVIKSHCPTSVAFAPTGRLAAMQTRLEGLVQAVNLVQPPLAKFYDSLSDEQKARFDDIGAPGGKPSARRQRSAANTRSACGGGVMTFPTDRIDRMVQPTDTQKAKLDALLSANTKAADLIKASCPNELLATPPDRLAAEGKRLQAMLAAVQTIRPALADFYDSLSDEQKARFNNLGQQLFAED